MSLTGGLIPLGGSDKSSASKMAPLASVTGKKSTLSSGFDEFDDLLDAPVSSKNNSKKNKTKNKKSKKKSNSRKSYDSDDQSYDNLDEPDSPGGTLSPHYGNSMERDEFLKIDMPRGVGDGDLDDSILGGLMGGQPKPSKPKISESSKPEVREVEKAPEKSQIQMNPIVELSDTETIPRPPTIAGRRRPAREWSTETDKDSILDSGTSNPSVANSHTDDLFTAPVIRTSRPATGGRRSGVRGFSPESAQESSPPFDATPVLTPLAPEPTSKILPVKPTKKMTDDWDDGDLDIDIDSLLTDTDPGKSKASVATAAKNVGKEQKPLKQQEPLDDSIDNFPIPVVNSAGNRPNTAPAAQERDIDIKVPEIVAKTDDTTSSNKSQKNNDDDVDLGFVPSFLESGREPRSRRQIGRPKTTQERTLPANRFGATGDEFDALDSALGFGNTKPGGRTVKAVDPFSHADTILQEKKVHPPTEQIHRSDSFRHSKISSPVSDEKSPHLEEKEKQDEGQASSIPRVISHKSGQAKPDEPTPLNASSLASLKEQQQHQEEKQKTSQHDQSVRLVSLPSLTAPKSPTEVHIDSRESQAKKSQNPPPSHMLSVQVEDSMDEPISYPPTAVMPTHSASEPEINYKSPSKSAGTVTFGPTITTPANPTTPANAKKILKRGGSGGEISSPPQQSGTPKRLSMPTWLSPNTSIDLGGSTSPHSRSKDGAALRHVQEKLEEVTLQKDATERYLRLEIESLKSRLDAAQNLPIDSNQPNMINLPNTTTSTSIPTSSSSSSANTIPVNSHDIEELKLKILSLQQENQNLKEEAMIERIKHQRELTQLKEKHQADLDLGNISKVEEITLLEKRHRDTIEALKKIHLDELNAIKQRAKDGVALDQLSNQIATTTGSLKLIEEQMNLKYRGIDAIREGQYEARERLLIEMEHKAIERAEAAEAEGYKLKGLLSHMEQIVENLRNQGGEERERLRMEHRRLEAMQSNLQTERKLLQERVAQELNEIKRKMISIDEKELHDMKKRAEELAEFNEMKQQFEKDKKEFASYVASHMKSVEMKTQQLKHEEEKLNQMKQDILKESNLLEQQREQASSELLQAEKWRETIRISQEDINREKYSLELMAMELQEMSNRLVEKDNEIERKEKDLQEYEKFLHDEKSQLQRLRQDIQLKEQEVTMIYEHTNHQRLAIKDMEEEIINKRKALANHRKEITKIQFLESFQHNLPLGGPSSAHAAPLPPPPPTVIPVSSSPNNSQYSPIDKNYSQSSNILHSTRKYLDFHELLPSSSSSTTRRPASEEYHGEYDPNQLEEELNSAKKVMEMAKNGIHRTSQKRIQNERFLQNENKFLNNMKRR